MNERASNYLILGINVLNGYKNSEWHSLEDLKKTAQKDVDLPEYARPYFMGFDLKKTPNGNWYVIEVNGRHSGLKGLEKTSDDFSQDKFDKEVRKKYGMVITENPEGLVEYVSNFGFKADAEGKVMEEGKEYKISDLIDGFTNRLLFNSERFEAMLENKAKQKFYLPRSVSVPYRFIGSEQYKPSGLKTWIDEVAEKYPGDIDKNLVVFKKPFGSLGKQVKIVNLSKLRSQDFIEDSLAEPFIRSAPINSSIDLQPHDGCMRYGVVVDVDQEGKADFTHAGGYWRLSPVSVDKFRARLNSRYRANLSGGALAEKASDEDIFAAGQLVEETSLHMLSEFYGKVFTS